MIYDAYEAVDLKTTRAWAEIDLDAIVHNYNIAKNHANKFSSKLIAVVKADAYGHGAVKVALALEEKCSADCFAVATFEEALELVNGGVKSQILVLSEPHPAYYEELIKHPKIIPSLFQFESAALLSDTAIKAGVTKKVYLAVDTGMSRIGIDMANETKLDSSVLLSLKIANLEGIKIIGVFSHFATADQTDKESALMQNKLFSSYIRKLEAAEVKPEVYSLCNSAALTEDEFTNKYDRIRFGIGLYGINPSNETKRVLDLKPAMSLYTRVTYVKTIDEGVGVSYGRSFISKKKTRVATLSIGYADGYPRLLSNKASVLIEGKEAKIIGRICMDQMMIDVTDIENVKVGSIATLIGKTPPVSAETLAEMIGTIPYEILCSVSRRVPRIYK